MDGTTTLLMVEVKRLDQGGYRVRINGVLSHLAGHVGETMEETEYLEYYDEAVRVAASMILEFRRRFGV